MPEEYIRRGGITMGREKYLFQAITSGKCEILRDSGELSHGGLGSW